MIKIGIIGNLGDKKNQYNGQSIKTKTVIKGISEKFPTDKILICDTNRVNNSIFTILKRFIKLCLDCDLVVLMTADLAFKFFVFPVYVFSKIKNFKTCYILIGAWLGKVIIKHPVAGFVLRRFDRIFSETVSTKCELERQGFNNIELMLNCKDLSPITSYIFDAKGKTIRLCTVSRVVKGKGLDILVNALSECDAEGYSSYILDIYGEVDKEYQEAFKRILEICPEKISYKGVLSPNQCPVVISNYDALVFPTQIMTEGIPGTIIDAMFAGTPVIASRWNSFDEIIKEGVNGLGYDCGIEGLKNVLKEENLKNKLFDMRKNCTVESQKFVPSNALAPLYYLIERTEEGCCG